MRKDYSCVNVYVFIEFGKLRTMDIKLTSFFHVQCNDDVHVRNTMSAFSPHIQHAK